MHMTRYGGYFCPAIYRRISDNEITEMNVFTPKHSFFHPHTKIPIVSFTPSWWSKAEISYFQKIQNTTKAKIPYLSLLPFVYRNVCLDYDLFATFYIWPHVDLACYILNHKILFEVYPKPSSKWYKTNLYISSKIKFDILIVYYFILRYIYIFYVRN